MKNVFTKSVIAATVFSAFAATAGTVDVSSALFAHDTDGTTVGATTRAIIVSKELIDNSTNAANSLINRTLTAGAVAGQYGSRTLTYSSPVDLKQKSTLVFKFEGGAVKANTGLALLRLIDNGGANSEIEVVGTVTDFVADSAGNYTSVKFQLNDGINDTQVNADEVLVIGDSADADDTINTTFTLADVTKPQFVLASGSSALTVTVPEVRDDNAQLLNAPTATTAETIASVINQFEFTVTKNTDKIDVDQDRTFFTDSTGDDESAGTISVDETQTTWAASNKGFRTSAAVSLTVAGTQDAITDIAGTSAGAFTYDEDENEWTDSIAALSTLIATNEVVTATVDGETEIEEATYPVTATIGALTAAGEYGATAAFSPVADTTLLDWKLNAATATIPYMPFASTVNQVIYLTNKGTSEGRIFVDVWAQDGEKVVSNVQLTGNTIPNGISFLTKQIQDLVAGKVENEKVTIKVIAEIPQNEMEVFSAFNVGGTDRGLVINDSNTTTNRQ